MEEIKLTAENFDNQVLRARQPVLVDFYAGNEMCGALSDLAEERKKALIVGRVNLAEEPALAARFGLTDAPAIMAFRRGKPAGKTAPGADRGELLALLREERSNFLDKSEKK